MLSMLYMDIVIIWLKIYFDINNRLFYNIENNKEGFNLCINEK